MVGGWFGAVFGGEGGEVLGFGCLLGFGEGEFSGWWFMLDGGVLGVGDDGCWDEGIPSSGALYLLSLCFLILHAL